MEHIDPAHFHDLNGIKRRQRIAFRRKDYPDYVIMIALCAAVIGFGFGWLNPLTWTGLALCAYMIWAFPVRHGAQLSIPILLARPQDVLFSLIHKVRNIHWPFFAAIGILLAEQLVIYLTPNLPHKLTLTHQIALWLFYAHIALITAYRTAILVAHLYKRAHVREVLMQSHWKMHLQKQPSITLEIVHAYCIGLLTHIVYLVPWFLVIRFANFSLLLLPATCVAAALLQKIHVKTLSTWFYRDHWLGHNSEFDFVYLHGTHHDAIPSGLIGVAGNGFFEGFFRGALAFPIPFYNPLMAAVYYTVDVKIDIDMHQYIPALFPKIPTQVYAITHHSTHHFGSAEPYGFGIKVDQPEVTDETRKRFKALPDELKYSLDLDSQLTGYDWNNSNHRWFMALVDKYQPSTPPEPRGETASATRPS